MGFHRARRSTASEREKRKTINSQLYSINLCTLWLPILGRFLAAYYDSQYSGNILPSALAEWH
jgi:hypothetical protein